MNYENIHLMSQNWTHAFISGQNYVKGRHVYEDMLQLALDRSGQKIVISWFPQRTEELFGLTPRVRETIAHYRKGLPLHLKKHGVDLQRLSELRTEVFAMPHSRLYVRAYAKDDKGKEYVAFVYV